MDATDRMNDFETKTSTDVRQLRPVMLPRSHAVRAQPFDCGYEGNC